MTYYEIYYHRTTALERFGELMKKGKRVGMSVDYPAETGKKLRIKLYVGG